MILAAGMTPIVRAATDPERTRSWPWRPPAALVIVALYVAAGVILLAIGSLLVAPMGNEVSGFALHFSGFALTLQSRFADLVNTTPLLNQLGLSSSIAEWTPNVSGWISAVLGGTLQVAGAILGALDQSLNLLFILLIALYLCLDGGAVRNYI